MKYHMGMLFLQFFCYSPRLCMLDQEEFWEILHLNKVNEVKCSNTEQSLINLFYFYVNF